MSKSTETLGIDPAFPVICKTLDDEENIVPGLTKREWFAGMALSGLMANDPWMQNCVRMPDTTLSVAATARFAAEHADALIAALNKQETP